MGDKYSYSSAPVRLVTGIQFGIMDPDFLVSPPSISTLLSNRISQFISVHGVLHVACKEHEAIPSTSGTYQLHHHCIECHPSGDSVLIDKSSQGRLHPSHIRLTRAEGPGFNCR